MFDDIDKKGRLLIILIITNVTCVGIILYLWFYKDNEVEIDINNNIVVQIAGEVNYPDVYEVAVGTRLSELIVLAGGFTENANISAINMSISLSDEMKITIPSIITDQNNQCETNGKVNINTADKETLMSLKGIGEVKAQSIIDFREQYGPFQSIEEIQFVNGIGEKIYEDIKDDIYC